LGEIRYCAQSLSRLGQIQGRVEAVNTGLYINQASNNLVPADRVTVELTESVEFKSLPSGLHHVEEDLVYVYGNYNWRAILS